MRNFHCCLPIGSVAVWGTHSTAYRPEAVQPFIVGFPVFHRPLPQAARQRAAEVPLPTAVRQHGGMIKEFCCPLTLGTVAVCSARSIAYGTAAVHYRISTTHGTQAMRHCL